MTYFSKIFFLIYQYTYFLVDNYYSVDNYSSISVFINFRVIIHSEPNSLKIAQTFPENVFFRVTNKSTQTVQQTSVDSIFGKCFRFLA